MNGGNEDAKWGGSYGEQQQEEEEEEIQEVVSPHATIAPVVGSQFVVPYPLELTVVKKKAAGSVYNLGDFVFKDPSDSVIFLVSARNDTTRSKRVLLNSAGVPILSAHRKALSFYNRWDAYRGESQKHEDALFSVKRSAYFQLKTSLHVFVASHKKKESKPTFKVKGNFHERECTISHGSRIVAEVKRKGRNANLPLDKDTFAIFLQPGIDHALIVALVIIMDEIHREQDHNATPQG